MRPAQKPACNQAGPCMACITELAKRLGSSTAFVATYGQGHGYLLEFLAQRAARWTSRPTWN